jgi:hypothetical protein
VRGVVLAAWLHVVLGCGDSSEGDSTAPCCSTSAGPIFLESQLDDDDGDGNTRDESFPVVNDEDDDIADHAWIRDRGGTYHLFFQNEDHGSGTGIEHYTSTDLRTLDYVGRALDANPSGWDSYALWSPHVIEDQAIYYMFYTGTTGVGPDAVQRIGVAISHDLVTWVRAPINHCPGTAGDGCVCECDEPWTAWGGAAGSYNQQCRDPFVVWDDSARRWVLFATAKSTNQFGVVTVAYSTDLRRWTGAGYIDATRRLAAGEGSQKTGGQAENPHVMSRGGRHYLLFTDWQDPEDGAGTPGGRAIVQYAVSAALVADSTGSAGWAYRGPIPDPGVNAIEVQVLGGDTRVMSQSISNENSGDHADHRRHLRLKCVQWGPGDTFTTTNLVEAAGARASPPLAPERSPAR